MKLLFDISEPKEPLTSFSVKCTVLPAARNRVFATTAAILPVVGV